MRSGQLQRLKIMLGKPEQPQSSFLNNKWQEHYAQLNTDSKHTAMGLLTDANCLQPKNQHQQKSLKGDIIPDGRCDVQNYVFA